MCFMCQITGRAQGHDEGQVERVEMVRNAIRANTGNRAWFHGFLMNWRYDPEELIELAQVMKVSPEPFAITASDGKRKISDWPALYDAVVDRATEVLSRNVDTPEAAEARSLGQLLRTLAGCPDDAEGRWLFTSEQQAS